MKMNRRSFLTFFLKTHAGSSAVSVSVLEVFGSEYPLALLVHHADERNRTEFAQWLRAQPEKAIRIVSINGQGVRGTMFRVRMCFGRGLILLETSLRVEEGDTLTITAA